MINKSGYLLFTQREGCSYVFGRCYGTEVGGTVVALESVDMVSLGAKEVKVSADIREHHNDEAVNVKAVMTCSFINLFPYICQ